MTPTIKAVETQDHQTLASGRTTASLFLFFAVLSLYLLTLRGRVTSVDEWHVYGTTETLVSGGGWRLQIEGLESRAYSRFSVLPSIVNAPTAWIGTWIADRIERNGSSGPPRRDVILSSASVGTALVSAATVAMLFRGLLGMGIAPGVALASAFICGFGTLLWPYSGSLYVQPLAGLAVTGLFFSVLRSRVLPMFLWAFLLVATRSEFAVLALCCVFFLLHNRPTKKPAAILCLGVVAGLMLSWLTNWLRGDGIISGDYSGEGFTTPIWIGLHGLLLSSGKGLAFTAPWATVGLAMLPKFLKFNGSAGRLIIVFTVPILIMTAAWWTWHGGYSWGPRLLLPVIPVMCIPTCLWFSNWSELSDWRKLGHIAVCVFAILMSARGALGNPVLINQLNTENESIYIPQAGTFQATADDYPDLLLPRWMIAYPHLRAVLAASWLLMGTTAVLASWLCLLKAQIEVAKLLSAAVRAVRRMATPLLIAGGIGFSPLIVESCFELTNSPGALPGSAANGTAAWTGRLYAPLQGHYTLFVVGGRPQLAIDERPIPAFGYLNPMTPEYSAELTQGWHSLAVSPGGIDRLRWTTPGKARFKEPIPSRYLSAGAPTATSRFRITIAHWRWVPLIAVTLWLFARKS